METRTRNIFMQEPHKGFEKIPSLLLKNLMARGVVIKMKWQTQ